MYLALLLALVLAHVLTQHVSVWMGMEVTGVSINVILPARLVQELQQLSVQHVTRELTCLVDNVQLHAMLDLTL